MHTITYFRLGVNRLWSTIGIYLLFTLVPKVQLLGQNIYPIAINESYTISAPTNYTNYRWQKDIGAGYQDIVGATNNSYTVNNVGKYRYLAKDANNCTIELCDPYEFYAVYAICAGESYTLTAQSGLNNLQWQKDVGTGYVNINGANNGTYLATTPGKYRYTATDANGCSIVLCNPFNLISGVCNTAKIGDYVFIDSNKNGIQDNGDLPLEGVTVILKNVAGSVIQSTTSDNTGHYTFNSVAAGTYKVQFITPVGYNLTTKNAVGSTAANNSDVNTNGETDVFSITQGQIQNDIDAGYQTPCVSDAVINGNKKVCANTTTTLTASVGQSYLWNTGATTQSITVGVGTYSVTINKADACSSTASVTVTNDNSLANATIQASTTQLTCITPNVTLSTTVAGASYLWSTSATTSSINVTQSGTYSVTITNSNACTKVLSIVINKDTNVPNGQISANSQVLTCTNPSTILTASGGTNYLWNTGNINPSISVSTADTYSVTITGSSACSVVKTITITEDKTVPLANINPSSAILTCANPNRTLTASGGSTYTWINGSTSNSIVVTTGGNYTVTVTGANGCSATAQSVVTVNKTKPTVCINPLNGILSCGNPSISISTTCQSGTYAYNWSNGQTSPSITVNQAGIYFLTVTNTANGCTAVGNSVINNDQTLPVASITPNTTTLTCSTPTATLIASGNGTYLWSTGAVSPSITVSSAGTYTVTVTGNNGCNGIANAVVFEDKSAPIVSLSPISGVLTCTRKSIKITASGGVTYLWSNGSIAADITVNTAGTYIVTVTGSNGCTSVKSAVITENKIAPIANINPSSATLTCANPNRILTASGGSTYLWSNGSTSTSITVNSAGTYTVTVTGSNGCTSVKSAVVTENKTVPVANISPSSAVLTCANPNATLTASGGSTYLWPNGSTSTSITVNSAGTYTATVTGSNGCTSIKSAVVTENKTVPVANINPSSAVLTCANPNRTLTASGGSTYLWSNGSTSTSITVSSAGTYTVTVTGSNGCTSIKSAVVTENKTVPVANISPSSAVLTCANPSATLTANGGGTYLWSNGSTSTSITVNSAGTYTVTVTGSNGCTSIKSAFVTENKTVPVANISPSSAVLTCSNPNATLTTSGGGTYLWNTGSTSPNITVTTAGTYSVTVTGSNGCTAVKSTIITEDKVVPLVSISPNSAVLTCSNPNATLTASGGGTYLWSNGSTSPNITVTTVGTYSVTVTGSNGCFIVKSVVVTENKNVPKQCVQPLTGVLTCSQPTMTLVAIGGGTYLWSTGSTASTIVVNTAGTYSVTVTTPNGCTTTGASVITENKTLPIAVITPNTGQLTCTINSVLLTVSGNGSYSWGNNVTSTNYIATQAGTYTVSVTGSNGCINTAQAIITENKSTPNVTILPTSMTLPCGGGTVKLVANGGSVYRWSTGATSTSINVSVAGTYTVTATSTNGCTKSTSISIGAAINCNTGSIGDYVFCDKNCNGIQDAGDTPINGVSVQLKNANTNAIISTTTTNNLGKYVFSNLVAGAYKVCFVTPIGYTPTLRKALNSTNANDSDIYATGETAIINLTSAQKLTNIDAGYKPYSSIGDCVFEDKNGNGLQDIGELGVPNIQVFLTGTVNGTIISKTATTNSSGKYLFSDLAAGTYSLYFALPSGYNFTTPNRGLDDEKDSDVDPLTYKTSIYTLSVGQKNLSVDAGIYKLACIGDLVFIDANRNGIQDNGEISRSNVSLALTGVTGDGEIVNNVYTATNAEGKYKFYGLRPGTYCVSIYTPTGYLLTTANVGADDSKDSDFDNSTFKTPNVTLISGVDYLDFDAGIYDKFANPCPNDITPPIFVGIPANITVECDAIPYSSPSVIEDCILGYDLIKNDVIIPGNCANNVTVQRTWTATDRSGNTSQVTQTITVRDTKPPVIYGVPADVTIQCGDPIPVAPPFSPTGIRATDNCDKDVTLTLSEIYYSGACTSLQHPNGIGQILCQWKAVDDCGNYSIKSWKITIVASSTKVASTSNNQIKEQQKEGKTFESSEISNNTEVLAFPNPTNGTFTLDFAGHKVTELLIFNSKGNTVYRSEVDIQQEQVKIELNSVNTGIYWVLMKTTKGYLSKKIIFIE